MGELRLALLGSPRIFIDGEEKILRERKAIALLAYLAVESTPQRRDTLATLFWPEQDQKRARANLRYLLWSLRKNVGAEWLATDGDQIALAGAGKIWLDVEGFRQGLDGWRAHIHPADEVCAACVESLEIAVQLYQGDFLQGFTLNDSPQFDDWQFFQSDGLRRELAAGLEALVEQQIAGQDYDAAIAHARRWLALDLLHEPASRALMKLYAWTDQYEAAIRQFHRCALALQEEIGVEPDEETRQLYAQIRNRRFPPPSPEVPSTTADESETSDIVSMPVGNLPPVSTGFVGRQAELAQIAQRLVDPSARLLTIVGPGGMGKSTLAMQAGWAAEGYFPDGVWFVSLAGMESPEQLPNAILAALETPAGVGTSARQQLFVHLLRKQTLLILDNFEDVLSAAELVGALLHTCPQVKVLVTSRERLNLREEWLLLLGNLSYPTDAKAESAVQGEYSALRLFELSAQRTQPAFALDAMNLSPVIRICQLVDGMPLALEMAAAWVRALPLAEIPAEIEKSLAFLSTAARDVVKRHRSIHAVFDSSWQMLSERERSVLRQLPIFRNGFTREGAEAVAGASLLTLSALLDKSWIRLEADGRYQMHGLAYQYALEKLQSGKHEQATDVLQRHCLFYAGQAPGEKVLFPVEAIVPRVEIENIKLAWETALEQRHWTALRQIASSIYVILNTWGNLEILSHLERTITRSDTDLQSLYTTDVVYAHLTSTLSSGLYSAGQFAKAKDILPEALAGFEYFGDTNGSVSARLSLAIVNERIGRYQEAEEILLLMASTLGSGQRWNALHLGQLGKVYTRQGRYAEAQPMLEEAYALISGHQQSHVLINLGAAIRGSGKTIEARELLLRGLAIADEAGDRPAQSDLLAELGFTAIQLGESALAQSYFSRSLAVAQEIGRLRNVPIALGGLGEVELMQGRMPGAKDYFVQALTAAGEVQAPPDVLGVLVGVGELYVSERKREKAIRLLELVQQHTATTHETRTRAQHLLQTLGEKSHTSESKLAEDTAGLLLEDATRNTLAELKS